MPQTVPPNGFTVSSKFIYLDNAATSGQRPESVYQAVDDQLRRVGGAAGRGQHGSTLQANQIALQCRTALATLINASAGPSSIALTSGCTIALNQVIHGLLPAGSHVVTSAAEHNSVLRPIEYLRRTRNIEVTLVPCTPEGSVDVAALLQAVRPDTRMIAITAASNVTGALTDLEQLSRELPAQSPIVMCDAAQAVGYVPVDVDRWRIDALVMPGHKGLLGPLGTGAIYLHPKWHRDLVATIQGGTGISGDQLHMPDAFPQKLEAGNLNVPGFAGLNAGIRYLLQEGLGTKTLQQLTSLLLEGLVELPRVHVIGPTGTMDRLGVVSVTLDGWSPHEVAATLDANYQIQTRAGLHCAPLIHQYLGTAPVGTVRLSLGHFSTPVEVERVIEAFREMTSEGI